MATVSKFFHLNPSTLSGCLDVIVIAQPDGSLKASPFHLRFGKFKVLKTKYEPVVRVIVNGTETDIQMRLGQDGSAFFVGEEYEEKPKKKNIFSRIKRAFSPDKVQPVKEEEKQEEKPEEENEQEEKPLTEEEEQHEFAIKMASSSQLVAMGLHMGQNIMRFEVDEKDTGLKAKATIGGRIFLWDHLTKIVISDVDGTITKSDVKG